MYFKKRADPIELPKAYVVSPSGQFDGNDGKWSTFAINVGDYDYKGHGQNFRVLISTSSPITLVPATATWCDEDCAKNRGIMVYKNDQPRGLVQDSSLWQSSGLYSVPLPYWWSNDLSANTTGVQTGDWGLANLGMGESSEQSDVVEGRWVVSYAFQDFFLGSLGLAAGEIGVPGSTKANFLTSLYSSEHFIPSLSYGYTAGAYYRNNGKGVLGSLVLGGYDRSRMATPGTMMKMPSQTNNTLAVGVQSIIYKPNENVEPNEFSFTSDKDAFSATIDSTLPYLILPTKICDLFRDRFQLGYDSNTKLYTVNATAHAWNLQQNATVRFKIVDGPNDSVRFTTISLPYAAFVQYASYPTYSNSTQYFPIKKSSNGLYVLGRTFLQEAYVVVDCERANFTVAPASFANPTSQDVVPIFNTTYSGIPHSSDSGSGLSAGAIAGIVVGIVLAFILAGIGGFIWWRKRENKKKMVLQQYEKPPTDIDTVAAGNEVKYRRVSELTGSETAYSPKTSTTGYYNNDHKPIPPISEMSPESTPAELYSPPPESASDRESQDYFNPGGVRRRGATRSRASSGLNTPGTPIAELPGDEGVHVAAGQNAGATNPLYSPMHSRGPSDTSLSTNIDEVLAGRQDIAPEANAQDSHSAARHNEVVVPEEQSHTEANTDAVGSENQQNSTPERRPSHGRGLSDSTIHSDSTAVSQPTPEELERWARSVDDGPNRPLSQ